MGEHKPMPLSGWLSIRPPVLELKPERNLVRNAEYRYRQKAWATPPRLQLKLAVHADHVIDTGRTGTGLLRDLRLVNRPAGLHPSVPTPIQALN